MDNLYNDFTHMRSRSRELSMLSARASTSELGRLIYPNFQAMFYMDVISDHLEACLRHLKGKPNGIKRLAISCSFQHGKSSIVDLFVARALGLDPSLRIVSASYGVDFARTKIANVQRLMSHANYQAIFPTRFGQAATVNDDEDGRKKKSGTDKVQTSANLFQVRAPGKDGRLENFGGSCLSTSLGASLNGRPYDIGVIDDPHKDEESAASPIERRHIEERYDTIFESREGKNSIQVFAFTRMGEEDLFGYAVPRWLKAGIPHAVLRFPAIQDEDTPAPYDPRPFGHGLAEPLYPGGPGMRDREWYETKKKLIQPWTWETCWQQRPTTRTGSFFDSSWWRAYNPQDLRDIDRFWISIDCATKATGASWTCADLWASKGPMVFKLDELRGHWDLRQFEREFMNWITEKWGREVRAMGSAIIVEDGGFGRVIHDDMVAAGVRGMHLLGTGGLSKTARATMVLDMVRNGLVHLPSGSFGRISAGWVDEHKTEYGRFPALPCDRVDAGVQALRWHLDLLRAS